MKKIILLLVTLMLSLSLVSCKKDDRIVVRFAVTSGQIATAIRNLQFEDNFESANPEINVELIVLEGGYDDLRAQTIMDINTGNDTAPDIVIGYQTTLLNIMAGAH